jgi:thiamine biosynthesis lipoprotein
VKAAVPGRIALGSTPPEHVVHRFAHEAMATVFEVLCAHDDAGYARQAAHAAFDLVDRLEEQMSRFIANSDIARINELTAGRSTRVNPTTLECLEIARHMFDLTGGAFDISIGTGLLGLELDFDDFTVLARAEGIRLDLGGIGKGFAVDRKAELLEELDIQSTLVHGGFSSVLALEPPPGLGGWPLTLRAPESGAHEVLARISARRMALSASGTRKGDHIVDPSTGRAVRGRTAWATLTDPAPRASLAAVAEGLSTAFMILPTPDVEEICRCCPGLEAWLVLGTEEESRPETGRLHLFTSTQETH